MIPTIRTFDSKSLLQLSVTIALLLILYDPTQLYMGFRSNHLLSINGIRILLRSRSPLIKFLSCQSIPSANLDVT